MTTSKRTVTGLKFEPDAPEQPGPVTSFRLVRTVTRESRRTSRESWRQDASAAEPRTRAVLAEGITRRQVADLIADAADWLCYAEGQDY